MAVVVYVCDTCKREIELPQVVDGVEVMSHCVITSGCKGKLHQTAVKTSHVRGKLPDPDPTGLRDWMPRRAYYKAEQPTALRRWKVQHNLGTNPSIQTHIYLVDGTLIETSDFTITSINPFEVELTFPEPRAGIVQCFARSSVTDEKRELIQTQTDTTIAMQNITGGGVLTLAVLPFVDLSTLKIGFTSSVTGLVVYHQLISFTSPTSSSSPWWKQLGTGEDYAKVFFSGKAWNVMTARLDDDIMAVPEIVNGSPFFFTIEKPFTIKTIDVNNKTITVEGSLNVDMLPSHMFNIAGSTWNDGTYHIEKFEINANNTTSIAITETIPSPIVNGSVVVDHPVDNSSVFVLLSTDPHTSYDKNTGEVINAKVLTFGNVAGISSQVSGVLFIREDQKRVVYPPIIII